MAGVSLELPTIQNWSCHSCGGCCRQHEIVVTRDEQTRIQSQNWTAADGVPANQPLFVRLGGWLSRRGWRLAHQPDGRCVFLDDRGLCRIHAKFGESAKPLACRIYPYAFHPAGRQVTVSLRFSCPSVVRNRGRAVSDQAREIRELARQVVPENVSQFPPPLLKPRTALDWVDVSHVANALDATLADESAQVVIRLLRALQWLDLIEQAKLDKITGPRLDELLSLLRDATVAEVPHDFDVTNLAKPSGLGRMQFRILAGHYARKDTHGSNQGSLRGRVALLTAALKLTLGTGTLPALQPCFRLVPFARLERSFGPLSPEAQEILTRYLRVKIAGLHFCGRAYYDVPMIEGFRGLALVYPAVLWIARWLAASRDRDRLTTDDVADALAIVDHHHGYSPALGGFTARSRVRTLTRLGDVARLCAWYSR